MDVLARVLSWCVPGSGRGGAARRGNKAPMQARTPRPAPPARQGACGNPHGQLSPGLRPLPLAGEGEVHEEQVERDDDGRDEETGDAQGASVCVIAHDIG